MIKILDTIIIFLVKSIGSLGYIGIFLLMFLESSFFPFPSEAILVPAGYLAYDGQMNIILILLFATFGSIIGALFNYYLAKKYGRKIILKYLKKNHLIFVENYFEKYGSISMLNGRLIPLVRQYISFPAGLAKMKLGKFILFTGIGAFIWSCILVFLGYFLGKNLTLINKYLTQITIFTLILVIISSIIYLNFNKKNKKNTKN